MANGRGEIRRDRGSRIRGGVNTERQTRGGREIRQRFVREIHQPALRGNRKVHFLVPLVCSGIDPWIGQAHHT